MKSRGVALIDAIAAIWPRPEGSPPTPSHPTILEDDDLSSFEDEDDAVTTSAGAVGDHVGKYRALSQWLRAQPALPVTLTFTDVEDILDMPLPPSSRAHEPHWYGYEGTAVGRAVRDAGWSASKVSIAEERVTFVPQTSGGDMDEQRPLQDLYVRFWTRYLQEVRGLHPSWTGPRTPNKGHWMSFPVPAAKLEINPSFAAGRRLRHELFIARPDRQVNLNMLASLQQQQPEIEARYGRPLEFDAIEGKRSCRVVEYRSDAHVTDEHRWDEFIDWFIDCGVRLRLALPDDISTW